MKTGGKTSFTHPLDEQYQITLFPLRKQGSEVNLPDERKIQTYAITFTPPSCDT